MADMYTTSSSSTSAGMPSADTKILADLKVVQDKIDLCRTMLIQHNYNYKGNDPILQIIGYLEACVPRMVELIESCATSNILSEDTMGKCFEVNDELTKILEDLDKDPPPAVAPAKAATGALKDDNAFDAFGINSASAPPSAGVTRSSSALDDLLSPSPSSNAKTSDDFDDFFNS